MERENGKGNNERMQRSADEKKRGKKKENYPELVYSWNRFVRRVYPFPSKSTEPQCSQCYQ